MHGTEGICGGGGSRDHQANGGGLTVRGEINKQASPNPGRWTLSGHAFNWAVFPAFRVSLATSKGTETACSFQTESQQMPAWLSGGNQT